MISSICESTKLRFKLSGWKTGMRGDGQSFGDALRAWWQYGSGIIQCKTANGRITAANDYRLEVWHV